MDTEARFGRTHPYPRGTRRRARARARPPRRTRRESWWPCGRARSSTDASGRGGRETRAHVFENLKRRRRVTTKRRTGKLQSCAARRHATFQFVAQRAIHRIGIIRSRVNATHENAATLFPVGGEAKAAASPVASPRPRPGARPAPWVEARTAPSSLLPAMRPPLPRPGGTAGPPAWTRTSSASRPCWTARIRTSGAWSGSCRAACICGRRWCTRTR